MRRGMFRLWMALSLVWAVAVGGYGALEYLKWSASPGKYQYDLQVKDKAGVNDPKEGVYSMFIAPTKTITPPTYSLISASAQSYIDGKEKTGEMQAIDFPDKSILLVDADLTADDKKYLAKKFWDQRQKRQIDMVLPWVGWAIAPPVGLLFLGLTVAWVLRGFTYQ